MMSLENVDEKRFYEATEYEIPHGDLAYSEALVHWHKHGCSDYSFFSFAPGQKECKLLIDCV